jgi:hypothetical protein
MRRKAHFLWIIALGLMITSCRKKAETEWDVDLVAPVVNGELNISNFLGDSLFTSDNTGLLHLSINRTLTSLKLDSLVKIPDTVIVSGFTWTLFPTPLSPGQNIISGAQQPLNFKFSNSVGIQIVDLEKGMLKVAFKNTYSQPVDFKYAFPGVTKNGVPLTLTETLAGYDTSQVRFYDLKGYRFDLRGNGGQVNTLIQTYTTSVNSSAQPAYIQTGEGVTLKISYTNLLPSYVKGYFGKQTITVGPDSSSLDLGKNFTATNFLLNSANVDFKITNDFGCELNAQLQDVEAIRKADNAKVNLYAPILSNINVNGATNNNQGSQPFTPSIKVVSLNNSNSNVKQCLELLPDFLKYTGTVNVNPLGNTSGFNDFAYLNSALKVDANIDIPMVYNADRFDLTSTSDFNVSKIKQLDNINFGRFIIKAENGFPFQTRLQAYLIDSLGIVQDSIFNTSNQLIKAGQLNSQNIVMMPTNSDLTIPVDKTKLENLKKARKVRVKARLLMPPNPPDIKLYENYRLKVKILVDINYTVKP